MKDYMKIYFPESRFGGFNDIDGTIVFYNRVNALLTSSDIVLDVGCGRGEYRDDPIRIRRELRILRGKVEKVIGTDLDPNAKNNPFIDEFKIMNRDTFWPVDDDSIDLVVSDWTLEHVEDPTIFFQEAFRVLKTNGKICIRTINRWGYISILSRLIPNVLHKRILPSVQDGRDEQDIFPAYYRCNTIPYISRLIKRYGLDGVAYGFESAPSYLSFSRLAYAAGVLYKKLAPKFLYNTLFVFAIKR